MQVCERLGPSLYDFLRKNNYRPFSADLVRDFGRQLLESVACKSYFVCIYLQIIYDFPQCMDVYFLSDSSEI